jgi:hypothetical protein
MFLARFRGNPNVGDIDTRDNRVMNVVFFAGAVVTLVICVGLLMYAFL